MFWDTFTASTKNLIILIFLNSFFFGNLIWKCFIKINKIIEDCSYTYKFKIKINIKGCTSKYIQKL